MRFSLHCRSDKTNEASLTAAPSRSVAKGPLPHASRGLGGAAAKTQAPFMPAAAAGGTQNGGDSVGALPRGTTARALVAATF